MTQANLSQKSVTVIGTLTVNKTTVFKKSPKQSSQLSTSELHQVRPGETYEVSEYDLVSRHLRVRLASPLNGEPLWYVWPEDVTLDSDEGGNGDDWKEEHRQNQGAPFKLPGYSSTFYLENPVIESGNFTWREVTKNGRRIPVVKAVVTEILSIAATMEEIRSMFGNRPITVTSWYRDPATNRRVRGASHSRHLTGGAVDFRIAGVSPAEVQRRLDPWWGSKGGLASASSFTHIDNRGYRARWSYGR